MYRNALIITLTVNLVRPSCPSLERSITLVNLEGERGHTNTLVSTDLSAASVLLNSI